MDATFWLALLSGGGIAAVCGLRAFLPLLFLGAVARLGWIQLAEGARWLSSDVALIALAVATVVELAGDKIPLVDHALDLVGSVLRPAAAWLGAYAVLVHWPSPWGAIVALLLGAGAFAINLVKTKLRIGTTAVTLGTANPLISMAEDLFSLLVLVVAVFAPLLILVVLVLAAIGISRRRRLSQAQAT